jgi:hypothetical protein
MQILAEAEDLPTTANIKTQLISHTRLPCGEPRRSQSHTHRNELATRPTAGDRSAAA